jgi:hypothetical protein
MGRLNVLVAVLEKDRLAPVAALRDLVRYIRNDDAGHARIQQRRVDANNILQRETMSSCVVVAQNGEWLENMLTVPLTTKISN